MAYRGLPYLVAASAGCARADAAAPPAPRRPFLQRLAGIGPAPHARRRNPGGAAGAGAENASQGEPEGTPAVLPATSGRDARATPRLSDVEPRKLLVGVLALLCIAAASALAGVGLARVALDAVDAARSPFATNAQAVNQSTPQSAWRKGTAPQLYQTDSQWADRPYGAGTIGAFGAAPTCLAMAHIALTGDVTVGPVEAASYSLNSGFAQQEDATALLTEGAAGLGLAAAPVEADEMSLRSEINRGRPVICATAPGTFDEDTSYIVLCSIDAYGRLVICDPVSSERTEEHWAFEDILGVSVGLWSYTLA